jgi:hypothetical protein
MSDRTDLRRHVSRLDEVEREQRDLFLRAHQLLKRVEGPEAAELVAEIDRLFETRDLEYTYAATLLAEKGNDDGK